MTGGVGGVEKLFDVVRNDDGEPSMYKPKVIRCLGSLCALKSYIFRISDDPPCSQ